MYSAIIPKNKSQGIASVSSSRGNFTYEIPAPPYTDKSCVLDLAPPYYNPAYSRTICDRSGYNNDGVITGATWVRLPSGLWVNSFDGTDDRISVPYAGYTAPYTLLLWIQTNSLTPPANKYIIDNSPGSKGMLLRQQTGSGDISFLAFYTVAGIQTVQTTLTNLGWNFLVVQWTSTSINISLNGSAFNTVTFAADTLINPSDTYEIGQDVELTSSQSWLGRMGLIRFINRALSASEISAIYNVERHLFGV
jgi:hypothetical protein